MMPFVNQMYGRKRSRVVSGATGQAVGGRPCRVDRVGGGGKEIDCSAPW